MNIPMSHGTDDCTGLQGLAPAAAALLDMPLLPPPADCGGEAGTPWMIGPVVVGKNNAERICGTSWPLIIELDVPSVAMVYPPGLTGIGTYRKPSIVISAYAVALKAPLNIMLKLTAAVRNVLSR